MDKGEWGECSIPVVESRKRFKLSESSRVAEKLFPIEDTECRFCCLETENGDVPKKLFSSL